MASSSSATAAIRPGLQRIIPLLDRLGRPQNTFPVIHIAGTNCKGTTSSLLDLLLTHFGLRTARFNSPHLREERDSCRVAGKVVDAGVWQTAGERVIEANVLDQAGQVAPSIDASPFERLFARFLVSCTLTTPAPQVLIVECGMGGLTDATNVFPAEVVLASVITPIGRDHAGFLGDTLGQITENKLGIAKENGLVVVAGQCPEVRETNLRRWSVEEEDPRLLGEDSAEILSTTRRVAETLKARLVRCETPTGKTVGRQEEGEWRVISQWSATLPPVLQTPSTTRTATTDAATGVSLDDSETSSASTSITTATPASLASTLFTNGPFQASPGHTALKTPLLPPLQPTAPVLSSVSTALSTIYAIASDEPPSARGLQGADRHEELRLGLAWALREGGILSGPSGALSEGVEHAIVSGVESWEGRGSWVDVPLPLPARSAIEEGKTAALRLFVDGAHNLPAFSALFRHLQAMRQARQGSSSSSALTLTLLVSFSESKKKDGDLETLLHIFAQLPFKLAVLEPPSLQGKLKALSLTEADRGDEHGDGDGDGGGADLTIRVGFVPFSTPVEGMPWVSPLDPQELTTLLQAKIACRTQAEEVQAEAVTAKSTQWEIISLPNLQSALLWASKEGQETGRPAGEQSVEGSRDSLVVLTGSLYLAGELYRLVDQLQGRAAGRG
ncbi:Mur ligase [Microstroma glucosiphilum]|uniref:Mur ligase n=1 Tax=Pseudomicrostroma glucosiphilum TaxID=1684307 RepID=A0A316U5F9_9BASI|nr:Mur ligase [Pseudomicrostroma glucosiphilum]PWN20469.1 Mur ligase [Pseudomicrostroma glucosiphilum]